MLRYLTRTVDCPTVDPVTGLHLGTAHPQLLVRASGKFALMDRMLDRLHRDGHQVLIFSQVSVGTGTRARAHTHMVLTSIVDCSSAPTDDQSFVSH